MILPQDTPFIEYYCPTREKKPDPISAEQPIDGVDNRKTRFSDFLFLK
jgi:hypothetical protein